MSQTDPSFDLDLLEGELELDDYKKDKQSQIKEMNKVMDHRLALLNADKKKLEPKPTPIEDKEENSQLILRPKSRMIE